MRVLAGPSWLPTASQQKQLCNTAASQILGPGCSDLSRELPILFWEILASEGIGEMHRNQRRPRNHLVQQQPSASPFPKPRGTQTGGEANKWIQRSTSASRGGRGTALSQETPRLDQSLLTRSGLGKGYYKNHPETTDETVITQRCTSSEPGQVPQGRNWARHNIAPFCV